MKKTKIFIDGQEGTTGLQIRDRLLARGDVELVEIDPAKRKDAGARAECLNGADVAVLCLPDAAAREAVSLVKNEKVIVVDASTAHRTLDGWAYGLPELGKEYREKISKANRIAVGGCHATAFLLGVRPLVDAGILAADAGVSAFSLTGYSGGGKSMIADYEKEPQRATLKSPRMYALGLAHKHLPEMRVHSGLVKAPVFNPVVGNFYKGLTVTVPLVLGNLKKKVSVGDLRTVFEKAYAGEKFVRVLCGEMESVLDGGFLDVQACNDTNRADVGVFGNEEQAVVVVRLDNLGKGASGAAVQCINLRLGLDEGVGLRVD